MSRAIGVSSWGKRDQILIFTLFPLDVSMIPKFIFELVLDPLVLLVGFDYPFLEYCDGFQLSFHLIF